jgi:hypothetical protein
MWLLRFIQIVDTRPDSFQETTNMQEAILFAKYK